MNPRSFLKAAVLLMLFPALICLFLPDTIAIGYTKIMHPLSLLIGSILSLRAASMYKNWLQKSFLFLALFLFLLMLANIEPLWVMVCSTVGDLTPLIILPFQWITYSMLVISSFYTLKVMERRGLSKKDWLIIAAMLLIGILIVMYQMISLLRYFDLYAIPLLLILFLDVAIVIMLTPVVLLYIRRMRLEKRESITFTTITCGIILSFTAAYGYAIAFDVPLYVVRYAVYHTGSVLDALYLFSYLIIAVGLYVHTKYDEWGLKMIEKALAGG
jgi:hypothetical protein